MIDDGEASFRTSSSSVSVVKTTGGPSDPLEGLRSSFGGNCNRQGGATMTRIDVPGTSRGRSGSRAMRIVVILVLLAIGGAAFWTWLTLAWAYSDGERAGVLQKFSRRGWLCQTQERALA